MKFLQVAAGLVLLCAAGAGGYWLLVDTVRYWSPEDASRPLRVSFWGAYEEFEMWKEMIADFRRRHPDLPVKTEYITVRYEQKIQQLFVSNDAPDVILYQDEPFPNFIDEGKFENLTRFAEARGERIDLERFWPTAPLAFGQYEGQGPQRRFHLYAVPIWGGCNLLFYNKEIFEQNRITVAPLPGPEGLVRTADGAWVLDDEKWNIDDFVTLCGLVTKEIDGRLEVVGLNQMYWLYWFPFHVSMGARILNEELTHAAFYGPECEQSLQLWQDMIYRYHFTPAAGESQISENVGFLTRKVAMFCTGPWGMPFLNQANIRYSVLHIPRGTATGRRGTRITWDAVGMFSGSKKKEQAWLLIKHLLSEDSQHTVAKVQRSIPATRAAEKHFRQYAAEGVEVGKFIQAAGDYALMQPITKHWSLMADVCQQVFSDLRTADPAQRLTPREAIGEFLSDKNMQEYFPPAEPAAAQPYIDAYNRRKARR